VSFGADVACVDCVMRWICYMSKRMICSDFYLYSYIKIGRLIVDARQRPWRPKKKKEREQTFWMAQESSARPPPDLITLLFLPPWRHKAGTTHTHPFSTGKQHHRGGGLGWIWAGRGRSSVSLAPSMCVCIYIYICIYI
jgi:hypothetical protein